MSAMSRYWNYRLLAVGQDYVVSLLLTLPETAINKQVVQQLPVYFLEHAIEAKLV